MLKKDLAENEPEPSPADSEVAQRRSLSSAKRLPLALVPAAHQGRQLGPAVNRQQDQPERQPRCLHTFSMRSTPLPSSSEQRIKVAMKVREQLQVKQCVDSGLGH